MSTFYKERNAALFSALADDHLRCGPSIKNLPAALTINGITQTPMFRYKGEDANLLTWPAWGYGPTLAINGSGADPTIRAPSPFCENGVKINGGKNYKAPAVTDCIITTEDYVLEYVGSGVTSLGYICAKSDENFSTWGFYSNGSGGYVRAWMVNDVGLLNQTVLSAVGIGYGLWHHAMIFVDRSGSAQWYINGVASGNPASVANVQTTLNKATTYFHVGAMSPTGYVSNANIAYVSLWKGAGWLDTHLQASIAASRCQMLTQTVQKATGSGVTTFTRAMLDSATLKKNVNNRPVYFTYGPPTPRKENQGYLIEPISTNTLQVTLWHNSVGYVNSTSALSTREYTPFQQNFAAELKPTSLNAESKVVYTGAGTSINAGSKVVMVGYFKPGEKNWMYFYLLNNGHYPGVYYGLYGSGMIGDVYQPPYTLTTQYIAPVGNGWYKVLNYVASLEATAVPLILVGSAAGNGSANVAYAASSTNTPVLYMGHINSWQVDHAPIHINDHPSFIVTKDVTITPNIKPADVLYYTMNDGNFNSSRGTLQFNLTTDRFPGSNDGLMSLSAGSSRNNALEIFINTSGCIGVLSTVGGVTNTSILGSINYADNINHLVKMRWDGAALQLYVDNVLQGSTTSFVMPPNIDKLYCGGLGNGSVVGTKWIKNLKILNYPE